MKNLSILLISFLCFTKSYGQVTVKLKPDSTVGKDAQVATSFGCITTGMTTPWENANYKHSNEMNIYSWTLSASGCTEGKVRSLLKFTGLSSIPASTVISAKLNLFCVNSAYSWGTSYFPGSPYPLSNPGWVERVTSPWNEYTVTWLTQPTTTTSNRATIPPSAARWGWTTSIDVTTLVNDILTSGSNEGFMLKLQTENYYRATIFATSDNADTSLWPELVISYNKTDTVIVANFRDTSVSCNRIRFTDLTTFNTSGIALWKWYFGDGDTSNLKNPEHIYAASGTYNVKLIVTDSTGKKDSVTKVVIININSLINVTASPKEFVGCNGDEIQLNASGAKYYEWSPVKGLTDNKIANPKAIISGSGIYVVAGTDSNGCTDMDTVHVTGYSNPQVKATSENNIVSCSSNILLTATGASHYSWTPAVYAESNFSSSTKVYPPATTVFTVRGWDENGCYSEDTITVFYDGKSVVKIPNAFTPNNDQINDKISPIYICDFLLTEFSIYNRWGNMVFTTNIISVPWDGTFKGKECEMGTYLYFLKGKNGKDEEVMFKGDITLVR